jgi:hypothetical protein
MTPNVSVCYVGNDRQSPYREKCANTSAETELTRIGYEIVDIQNIIRRVPGRSQGHLVQGSDGRFYVAKFAGNPEGNRTLINEWIAYRLFERLEVSTPALRVLRLSEETRDKAGLCFSVGSRNISVQPGLHLGSQCPVDPTTTAIFDFLPRKLLRSLVVNLADFAKAFVADKLLAQTDSRQCIFVRERRPGNSDVEFRAYMIDHGSILAASQWEFQDCSSHHGIYLDSTVYSIIDMHSLCGEAAQVIRHTSVSELYPAATDIPSAWFSDADYDRLAQLFTDLQNRVCRVDSLIGLGIWHEQLNDASARHCHVRSNELGPVHLFLTPGNWLDAESP